MAIGSFTDSEGTWVSSVFKSTAIDVLPTTEPKLDNGVPATAEYPPWHQWLSWAKPFRSQSDASTKPASRWRRWTTCIFSRSPMLPTVEPKPHALRHIVHLPISRQLAAELERRCNSWVSSTVRSSTPIQLFAGPKRAVTEPIKCATLPTLPAGECAAPITDTATGSGDKLPWNAADNEHAPSLQEPSDPNFFLTLPPVVLKYCEDYPDTSVEKIRRVESPPPELMPVSQIMPSMLDSCTDAEPEVSINLTSPVKPPFPEPEPEWLLPTDSGCPAVFASMDLEQVNIAAPATPLPEPNWLFLIDSPPASPLISERSMELDELLVAIGVQASSPLPAPSPEWTLPIDSSPSMSERSMELDELLVAIGVRVPTPLQEPEPVWLLPTDSGLASPILESCVGMNPDGFVDLEDLMEDLLNYSTPSIPTLVPLPLPLLESCMDVGPQVFVGIVDRVETPPPEPEPGIDHTQAPEIFPGSADDPVEYLYTVAEVHARISYCRATLITSPSCTPPLSTECLQRVARPLERLWKRPHGSVCAVKCT